MRRIIGLALIGCGAFLLAGSVLLRSYVAPTVVAAPTDLYQVTRLRAENASYFDAGSATLRTGATVEATNTVRGDVRAARGGLAVWDSGTIVEDTGRGTVIEIQRQRFAFDRRTGRLRDCCGAAVQGHTGVRPSGIGLFWPVRAEKGTLELFDPSTLRAWPITFAGEERVGGVRAWRYVQRVPETRVPGELPGVPGELLGRKAGGPPVPVDRYERSEATFWIDPRTGNPVDQERHVLSTLRPRQGPGRLVVADLSLKLTPASRRDLVGRSADGAAKIRLLDTVVPLGCAAAGAVALAASGLLLGRARRRAAHAGR